MKRKTQEIIDALFASEYALELTDKEVDAYLSLPLDEGEWTTEKKAAIYARFKEKLAQSYADDERQKTS